MQSTSRYLSVDRGRIWYRRSLIFIALALLNGSNAHQLSASSMHYRLETDTLTGTPISSISVNTPFLLKVFVQDLRGPMNPNGVFAGYLDVSYSSALATVDPSSIVYGSVYPNGHASDFTTAGLINQTGAFDGLFGLTSSEYLLWQVKFTPQQFGSLAFLASPDTSSGHDTLLYNDGNPIPISQQSFINTSLSIVPEPSACSMMVAGLAGLLFSWRFKKLRAFASFLRR